MELHTIGIDLGKTVFHLVGVNLRGEAVLRKRFHGKPASQVDWYGSLRRSPFSWPGAARARA
jgi:hypothetical protein